MAEPYPPALREGVVRAYESGEGSYATLAERFALGEATVKRWVWRKRKQGSVGALPKAGGTPSTISEDQITRILGKLRDPTAGEVAVELNRGRRERDRLHVSSVKRALHRFGYVVKKSEDGRWNVCGPTSK